ncbi:MAG: thermonuclease family protein [Rhodospirillales bacterium]|nr:thermonuclease family protein [Rhodospirillales bacterium]
MNRCLRAAAALVLVLLFATAAAAAEPIAGQARVIDGDTIVVAEVRVRIFGIDAPESRQSCTAGDGHDYFCGRVAASALAEKIAGRPVTCRPRTTDRYGRTVAVCFDAGDEDLGAWMVRAGVAIAYRKYSTVYVDDEDTARRARRGLWAGEFVEPSKWRAAH